MPAGERRLERNGTIKLVKANLFAFPGGKQFHACAM
jgi:hypothetical protein